MDDHYDVPVPRLFVNTYRPLVATRYGRAASERLGIPPFVDGSIRREPDLEHGFPSISCLCRGGNFCPRLRVGDRVVYLTVKDRYQSEDRHWRLTAVLRILHVFDTHLMAAEWYRGKGLDLPGNCIVRGNRALPLTHSIRPPMQRKRGGCGPGDCGDARHAKWDRRYRERAEEHPRFVVCRAEYRELSWDAPVVTESDLVYAFGRPPGTRNPGVLPMEDLQRLTQRLGILVRGA